ncbi:S66 family peptidase [Paludifilum halophilum]|uniref:LD-carboxypeptidase n=1 Tax=Paludifilum halophilum TaxID=1642702 RepID=A0A235B7D6_9BACL|nr:S66 peptidase family protein [Paludifilum halophilum]OYD08151.1 LD-carboxypeptidase [Paludifilum halophilum]
MKNTLFPPALKPGDTLALFSPSSPGPQKFPRQYELGKQTLKNLGYSLVEGVTCTTMDNYRSAPPHQRANEIHAFFENPQIQGIICTIGGYNSLEMLPYLDFNHIRKYPKFICGFSDTSVLLNVLYYRSRLITFHGPAVIPSFGEYPHPFEFTVSSFRQIAEQTVALPYSFSYPEKWTDEYIEWTSYEWGTRPRKQFVNDGPVWLNVTEVAVSGVLVGGNTNSLINILDTEYWEIPDGAILFIEDTYISLEQWAMMIWSLKLRGVFKHIHALLIGKIEGMSLNKVKDMKTIIQEVLKHENRDIPVVAQLDFGHTAPIMTLPIGSIVRVDPVRKDIQLLQLDSEGGSDV